jgi:hypothetical protein
MGSEWAVPRLGGLPSGVELQRDDGRLQRGEELRRVRGPEEEAGAAADGALAAWRDVHPAGPQVRDEARLRRRRSERGLYRIGKWPIKSHLRSEDATLRLCEPARRAVLGADSFGGGAVKPTG